MKVLSNVIPTPEQLPIISNPYAGITLIRGAAGSGKTTTALLMLKLLSEFWLRYKERNDDNSPVNILVLTFNRTLRGYIKHLAKSQIKSSSKINLEVKTFGKWAKDLIGTNDIIDFDEKYALFRSLAIKNGIKLEQDFLCDEIDYCLGRFTASNLKKYITTIRIGRGNSPKMSQSVRQNLLDNVVNPYLEYKKVKGLKDWNDLAQELYTNPKSIRYDIVITDETQDFSANEIRAIMCHIAKPSTVVFVLDAAQRIYPRGWSWKEVDIIVNPQHSFLLRVNHRNTKEICSLAAPLLDGLDLTDDGTIPDLNSCKRSGSKPTILVGRYSEQCKYAIQYIQSNIDLRKESVAFIHPKAGGWFNYLQGLLSTNKINFVGLSRQSDWPSDKTNVGLLSMHSAKGLEFDHIFILGLNEQITPHGNEEGDNAFENFRRLLAMSITRASKTITLGYKPGEASKLFSLFKPDTYNEIKL